MINGWLSIFLLFAVLVFVWWSARKKSGLWQASRSGSDIPPEYLKGLDFLLDQEHNKATELFIRLIKVDSDTVETHFILGNLFRQKGEMEKAIRIHHNITRLSNLSKHHTGKALFELGRDYYAAGLFDRAEAFFRQASLLDIDSISLETYPYLLSLYETEKNWWRAIKVAENLKSHGVADCPDRISHYYCELAEQLLTRRKYSESRKFLSRARLHGGALLRIMAIEGDMDFDSGLIESAERRYLKAFEAYPQYAKFLLPKILKTIHSLDAHARSAYLDKLRPRVGSITYLLTLCKSLFDSNQIDRLETFFSEMIDRRCIPLPVARLHLEYRLKSGVSDSTLISDIIKALSINESTDYSYQCVECGFEAHELYWQCPGCRSWSVAYPCDVLEQSASRKVFPS